MKARYWQYFKYVCRHKKNVYREGRKLGLGRAQLLRHDLSKFLPDEFIPYAWKFFGNGKMHEDKVKDSFKKAWLKHCHRNRHHAQHWHIDGEALYPGRKFVLEMVVDWEAMGIEFGNTARDWYLKKGHVYAMHNATRALVEHQLKVGDYEQR